MKEMTQAQINEILRKHNLWLDGEPGGERANLRGADLRGANLTYANLWGANLRAANLRGVDLTYANLRGADLMDANLTHADLTYANLMDANLTYANLRGVDLRGADLTYANLMDANLMDANLMGADLTDTTGLPPIRCPEEGTFIGFKKAILDSGVHVIVKLEICGDALRSSATTNKCRCSKAKVLGIYSVSSGDLLDAYTVATSVYNHGFKYTVGEIVGVHDFDTDRWNECSTGIHFFLTKQEAQDWTI